MNAVAGKPVAVGRWGGDLLLVAILSRWVRLVYVSAFEIKCEVLSSPPHNTHNPPPPPPLPEWESNYIVDCLSSSLPIYTFNLH